MNKRSNKILLSSAAVLSTAIIMGAAVAHQQTAHADTNSPVSHQTKADIASGKFGTSSWYITQTGILHIGAGELGPASDNPWNAQHYSGVAGINSIVFDGQVKANQDSNSLFSGMENVANIENLDYLDTSEVENAIYMFEDVSSLTSLDLSNFNTSKINDMSAMFTGMSSLEELNLSSFDTSNVTSMEKMFNSCISLKSLDLSTFNTSKVTNMSGMFNVMNQLEDLNLGSLDTSNVTSMDDMFAGCTLLKNLDLSTFNTSKVTNMSRMFEFTNLLTDLDVSSFDTSNVTSMDDMFYDCTNLKNLDLSSFNTSKVTNMSGMFGQMKLKKLFLGADTKLDSSVDLSNNDPDTFSGKWQNIGTGTVDEPNGEWTGTSEQLIARTGTGTADTYVALPNHNYVFTANDLTMKQSEVAELLAEGQNSDASHKLVEACKAEVKDTMDPDNTFVIGVRDWGGLTDEVGTYQLTLVVAGALHGDIPKDITKTINVTVVPDSDDSDSSNNNEDNTNNGNSDNNDNATPAVKYQKVYRLYNKNTGEHLYTESSYERDSLVKAGWTSEGTGWSAPNKGSAVYRVYNPNAKGGDHYYTASKYEATSLVKAGWKWDNNAKPIFYSGGKTPVYVAYNPNAKSGSHNYTTSSYEQQSLLNNGWKYGKIQFYGK